MRTIATIVLLLISASSIAGKFADYVGTYWPNGNGQCRSTALGSQKYSDFKISGVCVPISAAMDPRREKLIQLAITEMTNPEQLDAMIRLQMTRSQPTEAFRVQVEDNDDDIIELVDGSVLEKTSYGYIGYISYREDAILFQDIDEWKLCVDGDEFKVDILNQGSNSYGRESLYGQSVNDIESSDMCG